MERSYKPQLQKYKPGLFPIPFVVGVESPRREGMLGMIRIQSRENCRWPRHQKKAISWLE